MKLVLRFIKWFRFYIICDLSLIPENKQNQKIPNFFRQVEIYVIIYKCKIAVIHINLI